MGRRWVTCELLENNFVAYTLPRLTKVVNGDDKGGITQSVGERIPALGVELPDNVTPDDAAKFTSILNKLIAEDDDLKRNPVVKELKKLTKTTRSKTIINWRGGGGFQVAHLSPECFDYDPEYDRVLLTDDAKGKTLVNSIAANLGFKLLPESEACLFDAKRGDTYLKVVEGIVDEELVDTLLSQLEDECKTLVVAGTVVMDGVREHLRRARKGSSIVAIPDDVFRYSKGGDR